ncbi:hypothetical protein MKEN_00508600 [Mycena kentingensis (nom. inval.)]|nr:hypothetical protein MKEN_00508600 [Mycena kentingensis (nom. inval.)]
MFLSKIFALLSITMGVVVAVPGATPADGFALSARSFYNTRTLSEGMVDALQSRDAEVARCLTSAKRDCRCDSERRLAAFMEVAERAIDARECQACCTNCGCRRSEAIVCARSEAEFVERSYNEAIGRDILLSRCAV